MVHMAVSLKSGPFYGCVCNKNPSGLGLYWGTLFWKPPCTLLRLELNMLCGAKFVVHMVLKFESLP